MNASDWVQEVGPGESRNSAEGNAMFSQYSAITLDRRGRNETFDFLALSTISTYRRSMSWEREFGLK